MSIHGETPQPPRRVEADGPEDAREDVASLRRREDVSEVGGPEQPDIEDGWLTQGTAAYRRVTAEVRALGGFERVTLVQGSSSSALARHHDLPCAECMKESVVWAQALTLEDERRSNWRSNTSYTWHFCAVECMKVWALKQGLTRDEIQ